MYFNINSVIRCRKKKKKNQQRAQTQSWEEKNRLDMQTTECFMMLRARHTALNMNIVRKERKSEHERRYNLQSKANYQTHVTIGWQTTKKR